MRANLPLDADRLWADVMALAEITDAARPYTRRSFTPLFLEGRAWLAQRFVEAGLTTRIDTAGNVLLLFIMLQEGGGPVLDAGGTPVCIGIPLNQEDAAVAQQVRALTRCLTDMETRELLAKQAVIDRVTRPPEPPAPIEVRVRDA